MPVKPNLLLPRFGSCPHPHPPSALADKAVLLAMRKVYDTFEAVAIAKADDSVIPDDVIAAARTAEIELDRVTRRELINSD